MPDFYLGRQDKQKFSMASTEFLTHAAIMGASGSGKTVICKSIVEEAILAGIPVIAIDPKGDIGALGIGLGDFTKEKIQVHAEVEANDLGGDPDEIAEKWITLYQDKLEESFGEEFKDVEKEFSDKVATILVTPKNAAGIQISLTPNFEKPPNYDDLMVESPDALLSSIDLKIQLLLSRIGIGSSSSTDNRVIFLNNLVRYFWEDDVKSVSLAQLIDSIEKPPFSKIGSLSVDKFISKTKRSQLAQGINALMVRAVPGVELDFDKLVDLAKKKNKTPIIVFDLRKITDDNEKNSFVAEILGEIQRWVWAKGGTSRLRAILYFDELYGFMPAGSSSPPSKTALLILLKQARAAGLGCILASQNPGDLDYRGLSNIATWLLGRLATNQDIAKVQGALKPVFEGAGGTEEEFKALMDQIRALKPGNFIAYNSRIGVEQITTRWLLSLHKGPLTDKEIKTLTLKPPVPKRAKKAKPTPKEKKAAKAKKKEEPSAIALTNKPPALGKLTERFLKPRIDFQGDQLTQRLYERLSITGDPKKDNFSLEIGAKQIFYSPVYFSKTLINIKRTVKEGTIEIPVEISEEMLRSFDLTTTINWKRTSIEGVHPASLPPTDLTLEPINTFSFFDIKKDIITKLPDNLIWYFTSTPFPEADRLYQKILRDYEIAELEKISGGSKEFSNLSKEISRTEERIQAEEEKVKETTNRLELLGTERSAREAEGRSLKSIERSIDSAESKIEKHNENITDLKKKIEKAEEKRKDLISEQKTEYETFEKKIGQLKTKGTPGDLYRPAKTDIKILEKAHYWIPRALVPVTLKRGEVAQELTINLNLYNGNAPINCDGCGPAISTENYYEKLLETEISPPIFPCSVCLKMFCSEHYGFCKGGCFKGACPDHIQECTICKEPTCESCQKICSKCNKVVCTKHHWTCNSCEKPYCEKESFLACETCQKTACEDCDSEFLLTCNECKKIKCHEHITTCNGCNKAVCEEHLKSCKKCGETVCSECGRVKVKIKGEEVIARCVSCS
ncbi:MAG: helicase HerA-like domain-containing protein [Candidatus Hodarchaeales archaeon]|jgi:hypothetical protein